MPSSLLTSSRPSNRTAQSRGLARLYLQTIEDFAGSKPRSDLSQRPGHLLHNATSSGLVQGATTQDHHRFVSIWPAFHGENRLEGLATYHDSIDSCYELVVAVRFAAARRQKIKIAVRSRNEAVDAGANKTDTIMG
jgi:hypothetical protein